MQTVETSLEDEIRMKFENTSTDVLYATSDGEVFIDKVIARAHGKELGTDVQIHYRDPAVRALAEKHEGLRNMVIVTDFCKAYKAAGRPLPAYYRYLAFITENKGKVKLSEEVYNFVRGQVYRKTARAQKVGEVDKIYTYAHGIVEAIFLKRYPEGQLFFYGDELIFTCPTNTELAGVDMYYLLFPLLTKTPPDKS